MGIGQIDFNFGASTVRSLKTTGRGKLDKACHGKKTVCKLNYFLKGQRVRELYKTPLITQKATKKVLALIYIITPDEQISPPGLACKQNSLPLHSLCVVFFSTLLAWKFIYAKCYNITT